MVATVLSPGQDDTREKLLLAAHAQFAERGFHGASIALIAGEVGLTKQALLYHFKRKEELYGEVMKRIAAHLITAMRQSIDLNTPPEQRFEDMIAGIYGSARDNPLDTKVLMREVLDNRRRDTPREEWFLKTFIDEVIATLDAVEGMAERPFADKLARVYLLLSAIHFSIASGNVLKRFYGDDEFEKMKLQLPEELRLHARRLLSER